MNNPSLQIFSERADSVIHTDFEIETLTADCEFTEGPVWHHDGYYLFSDITANVVYKLVPGLPKEVYISQSGTPTPQDEDLKPGQEGSNGLAFDQEGNLLVCRHGSHMVATWQNGEVQPLFTHFNNRLFNSPNDIVVDQYNRVFFSDPPYGLKQAQPNPGKYQDVSGVYCADNKTITRICDTYQYPNGVCITPDGQKLYICSTKLFEKRISVYDLSTLQFERVLAEENSDGMKCDRNGNVYLSTSEGLLVLDRTGARLARISLPTVPANHCFGGDGLKDLFITARENIYLIRNLLK